MEGASKTKDANADDRVQMTKISQLKEDRVQMMKVSELKEELKQRGLRLSGKKAELIERLKAAVLVERSKAVEGEEDEICEQDEDETYDESEEEDENEQDDEDDKEDDVNRNKKNSDCTNTPQARKAEIKLNMKDVEELLEKFSGNGYPSVERWVSDFEDMAALYEWNDLEKVTFAKRLLQGSAKRFISYERCGRTWRKLKKALKEEFGEYVDSIDVHRELTRRKKLAGESYHDYIYIMLEIAGQSDIPRRSVMRYIIEGIPDDPNNKSLLYGAKTIKELKEKFEQYENMKEECKSKNKFTDKRDDRTKPKNPREEIRKNDIVAQNKRCYNCGEKDHFSSKCPSKEKGVKCFRCNEFGHVATKCPAKSNDTCIISYDGKNKYQTEIEIAGKKLSALVDTGSDLSLIRSDEYRKIGSPLVRNRQVTFEGLGFKQNKTLGEITATIVINDVIAEVVMHVVDQTILKHSIILGTDFIDQVELKVSGGVLTITKPKQEGDFEENVVPYVYNINVHEDAVAEPDLSHITDPDARRAVATMIRQYMRYEKFTAFVTPTGHFEFLKMPFGLAIAPAIFQKFINAVFKTLINEKVVVTYMDDVIILAKHVHEAVERARRTLEVAAQHGLEINWTKTQVLQTEIEYLGYIVSNGTVRPSLNKTNAVMNYPRPTNVKKVQSFLGLTGFFRKFIPQYSIIARPLTDLLRKKMAFEFGDREIESFEKLKMALVDKPALRLYQIGAETELHTDACRFGYGMVLLQKDDVDQKLHPIYYASGKTTPAEENYTSYELEVLAIIKALKKFRVYLLGIHFRIMTDCQAFSMTMRKKDLCVRVARWVLLLEEFSYEICHRPGKNMMHVDALSRNPLPMVLLISESEDGLLVRLRRAQANDENLKKFIEKTDANCADGYAVKDGMVFKIIKDDFFIVVPEDMQTQVVRRAHERGHFGVTKTEEIVKEDFWFKDLRKKVERVVASCLNCILAERKHGKQEGFLHSISKGDAPLDTYHIDHLGPMTQTKKKYQYIFIIVDAFTKFVWLFPTRSTCAAVVIDSLQAMSSVFGNPRRIISDRGAAFTSGLFKDYCAKEGIEHSLIVTGVPRSNGQVERTNRTLIPLLTKLAAPTPENWYKYVSIAQKYLNSTISRSTGKTPFHLMFGTNMRIRNDLRVKELLEQEWAQQFVEERDELRVQAREQIEKMQEANRKNFNKNRKSPTKFEVGDLVAIKRTQFGPGLKLHGKFIGPYEIVQVLRNDRYVVEKKGQHEGPRRTSTAADYMKPWGSADVA